MKPLFYALKSALTQYCLKISCAAACTFLRSSNQHFKIHSIQKKIIKFSGSRPSFQERNYRLIYFFFRSDVLFCFILFLLAISVGYMGNHCLTNAPKTSEDSDAQEATSLILTAVFVLGQASGSFFSLFVIRAI